MLEAHEHNQRTAAALAVQANRAAATEILLQAHQRQNALLAHQALAAQQQQQQQQVLVAAQAQQEKHRQLTVAAAQATMIRELRAQGVPEHEAVVRAAKAHLITFGSTSSGDDQESKASSSGGLDTSATGASTTENESASKGVLQFDLERSLRGHSSAEEFRDAQLAQMRMAVAESASDPRSPTKRPSSAGIGGPASKVARLSSHDEEEIKKMAKFLLYGTPGETGPFAGAVTMDPELLQAVAILIRRELRNPEAARHLVPDPSGLLTRVANAETRVIELSEALTAEKQCTTELHQQLDAARLGSDPNHEAALASSLEAEQRGTKALVEAVGTMKKQLADTKARAKVGEELYRNKLDDYRTKMASMRKEMEVLRSQNKISVPERVCAVERSAEKSLRSYMRATVHSLKSLCHEK